MGKVAIRGHVCSCALRNQWGSRAVDVRSSHVVRHTVTEAIVYTKRARKIKMFDDHDVDFRKVGSDSRLGVPFLSEEGMIFLDDCLLTFDRYNGFDSNNEEFAATTVGPRLRPPVMLTDRSIRCVREYM